MLRDQATTLHVIRAAAPDLGAPLIPGEIACLHEVNYTVDEKGKLERRPQHLPIDRALRFALPCLCKVTGVELRIDVSGAGWQAFQRSVRVRHRLTHPKSATDLDVSDEEMTDLQRTVNWFAKTLADHLPQIRPALQQAFPRASFPS